VLLSAIAQEESLGKKALSSKKLRRKYTFFFHSKLGTFWRENEAARRSRRRIAKGLSEYFV